MIAIALAAAPVFKLATPGLSYANIDPKAGAAYLDYFTQQIAQSGNIQVTTAAEIGEVVGLERQRQMLACEDGSNSCIAELAGAFGADGVITGSIARIGGGSFIVNLKIISTRDAKTLAVYSSRVHNEEALIDFLGDSARKVVQLLAPGTRQAAPVQVVPTVAAVPETAGGRAWLGAGAVGGALVAAGIVSVALANGAGSQLANGGSGITSYPQLVSVRSTGESEQGAGVALLGLGAAGLGVSAGMLASPRNAWWMPLAAGGASAVASGILFAVAKSDEASLRAGTPTSLDQAERIRSAGAQAQTASFVTAIGAAVGVGTGVALKLIGPSAVTAAVAPSSGGPCLALGGRF